MRDFQDFKDKRIAVLPTVEFMELCEKNCIKWAGRQRATEFKTLDGYYINCEKEGVLTQDAKQYFIDRNFIIVPASEFLTPTTPTITIFQSKQTVVCLKKLDGKVIAVGKAKCMPEDEFDFDFGSELAFKRMLTDCHVRSIKGMAEMFSMGLKDGLKSGLIKSIEINQPEQDGIKTLKNGMRIKKQDVYEVGDNIILNKKIAKMFKRNGIIMPKIVKLLDTNVYGCCTPYCYKDAGDKLRGAHEDDIAGKVL